MDAPTPNFKFVPPAQRFNRVPTAPPTSDLRRTTVAVDPASADNARPADQLRKTLDPHFAAKAEAMREFLQIAPTKPVLHPGIQFLKKLDSDGRHNLVSICPSTGEVKGKTFRPGAWQAMSEWVREREGRLNLYFSANEPVEGAPDTKLGKANIGTIRCVYADADPRHGEELSAERERLLKLASSLIDGQTPPSFAIDSGSGIQLLWMLNEKLSARQYQDAAEAQSAGIASELGGDPTQNIDRLLRLPGTLNIPTAAKVAKGRVPNTSSLVGVSGARYTLAEMANWYEPRVSLQKRPEKDGELAAAFKELHHASTQMAANYQELGADLRGRFETLLQARDNLAQLWETGEHNGPDQTASGRRFALASHLRRAEGFDVNDYSSLLWVWDHSVKPGEDPDDKLTAREVVRAWVRAAPADETDHFDVLDDESSEPETTTSAETTLATAAPPVAVEDSGDWAEPHDIFGHDHPLQISEPPAGCLPAVIERFARSEARRKGASLAFTAAAAIAAVGSAVGSSLQIQVKERNTDFVQPGSLWVVLVAEPGSAKSAVVKGALKPLEDLDAEWRKADAPKREEWERLKKKAAKSLAAPPPEAKIRRTFVDDVTTEMQLRIHADNPRGLMRSTDELAGMLETMGAYKRGGGGDRSTMLRLFEGEQIRVDRVGSGSTFAERALMGVLATTQPDKLAPMVRDLQSDGLLQRFLFVLSARTGRASIDEEPDHAAMADYRRLIKHLASAEYIFPGPIQIAAEARGAINAFIDQVLALAEIPGASAAWKGHVDKWEKFSARIILNFHAAEQFSVSGEVDPSQKVPPETVQRALSFCRFMLRHQLSFYNSYFEPDTTHAETVGLAGYLLAHPDVKDLTRRGVYQARGALKGPQNRRTLLQVTSSLEAAGWLQETSRDEQGASAWRVNPRIHTRFQARAEIERAERARRQEALRKAGQARKALEETQE